MNIQDIRRERLRFWIETRHADNVSAFCRAAKKSQSQIADMLDGRKAFGEKVARAIEAALNMGDMWLDIPQATQKDVVNDTKVSYSPDTNTASAHALADRIIHMANMKSLSKKAIESIDGLLDSLTNTYVEAPPNAPGLETDAHSKLAARAIQTDLKSPDDTDPTAGQN